MGEERQHPPVMLICGILASDAKLGDDIIPILEGEFGCISFKSEPFKFEFTKFYNKEMGQNITRYYIGFDKFIHPEDIASIKRKTNVIEKNYTADGNRMLNIDPGYITLAKLVLATTKDATHRVLLKDGIYAESTLYFKDNTFCHWQWTYPDYKSPDTVSFFNSLRNNYKVRLQSMNL